MWPWPVLVAALAATPDAAAQGPPCPEFPVNTHTTGHQFNASVASDAAGNFVVVWQSSAQFGPVYGIVARRFSSGGLPLGPELQVNTDTANGGSDPVVTSDPSGNFVVVWDSGGDGAFGGIFARRFDADGVPLGPQFLVNTFTMDHEISPSVSSDASGNFVVVWEGGGQDGSESGIFGQRFDSSGLPQGPEFQVNSYTTGPQGDPVVAADADGNFVVVWESPFHDVGDTLGEIVGRRFSASGMPRGPEFRVNTYTTGGQLGPAVASDAAGNFVVAWSDERQESTTYGVFGRWYDAAGVPRGAERLVNAYTTDHQVRPAVISDAGGDSIVIVWTSVGQDGSSSGIFGRRFDGLGGAVGPEFQVNATTADIQSDGAIAPGPQGGFVAAWTSSLQDGSESGIFGSIECARLYTVTPCRLADTRNPPGPSGGPALAANADRAFPVSGTCNIPADARAVAVSVTAVGATEAGDLRLFPAGQSPPLASALNFAAGRARAGNAVVPLGAAGQLAVRCDMTAGSAGSTHVVLDAYGYFKR